MAVPEDEGEEEGEVGEVEEGEGDLLEADGGAAGGAQQQRMAADGGSQQAQTAPVAALPPRPARAHAAAAAAAAAAAKAGQGAAAATSAPGPARQRCAGNPKAALQLGRRRVVVDASEGGVPQTTLSSASIRALLMDRWAAAWALRRLLRQRQWPAAVAPASRAWRVAADPCPLRAACRAPLMRSRGAKSQAAQGAVPAALAAAAAGADPPQEALLASGLGSTQLPPELRQLQQQRMGLAHPARPAAPRQLGAGGRWGSLPHPRPQPRRRQRVAAAWPRPCTCMRLHVQLHAAHEGRPPTRGAGPCLRRGRGCRGRGPCGGRAAAGCCPAAGPTCSSGFTQPGPAVACRRHAGRRLARVRLCRRRPGHQQAARAAGHAQRRLLQRPGNRHGSRRKQCRALGGAAGGGRLGAGAGAGAHPGAALRLQRRRTGGAAAG
jgi:hypothetical protein